MLITQVKFQRDRRTNIVAYGTIVWCRDSWVRKLESDKRFALTMEAAGKNLFFIKYNFLLPYNMLRRRSIVTAS